MPRPLAISNLRATMSVTVSTPGPTPIKKKTNPKRVRITTQVQTTGAVDKVYTTKPVFKAGPQKFTVAVSKPKPKSKLIGQRLPGLADRADVTKRAGTSVAPDGTMTEDKNGVRKLNDDHSND
jgi:hypothetical protein